MTPSDVSGSSGDHMTDNPDPDKTRETRTPPPRDHPTRDIPTPPPPDRPTREISAPQRPVPPLPPRPIPPRPAGGGGKAHPPELPWWQTIRRDAPPPIPNPKPVPQQRIFTRPPQPVVPKPPPRPPVRPMARPVQAPSAPVSASAPKPPRRALLFGVVAAVAVGVAVAIGAVLAGTNTSSTAVLDVTAAQRGVEQVLLDPVDGYGLTSVGSVVCNDGVNPNVSQGTGFECAVLVEGVQRRVNVVFQDDQATYAVDRPR